MSMEVSIRKAWKGFSLDVDFSCGDGVLGILGASGCGKSMTLKSIAGVERPDSGRIVAGGRVLYDSACSVNLRPQKRRIGYLFQSYALFPHMSVEENIACALGHLPRGERGAIIRDMLRRFRLEELGTRYPGQLSGGQQQRAALARILACEPDALLLDEPFSALDYYLKEQLQLELLDLLRDYRGDVVIVTHSRDEVYHLCRRLMVMEDGRCIAAGDTREVFRRPGLLPVARLTGCKNFSAAVPLGENRVLAADWGVALTVAGAVGKDIDYIGVRAHDFLPVSAGFDENTFAVTLRERLESPFEWNMLLAPPGAKQPVWWKTPKEAAATAAPDYLSVSPDSILLLRSGGPHERSDRQ